MTIYKFPGRAGLFIAHEIYRWKYMSRVPYPDRLVVVTDYYTGIEVERMVRTQFDLRYSEVAAI